MSRPLKTGLDYFLLDVYMDDNIELLEADFGLEGFAILIKLYQRIYANGYYINAGKRELKLFSRRINASINLVMDVINLCFRLRLFDSRLFKDYGILTSRGVQKRYFSAVRKRNAVEYIPEYFLLNISDYNNLVIGVHNPVNDVDNSINDVQSTQSRVEKSRVEKSRDTLSSKNRSTASPPVDNLRIQEANDVVDDWDNIPIKPPPDPIPYKKIVEYLNNKAGTSFKYTNKNTRRKIHARWNEGFRLDDFKAVIDTKYEQWKDDDKMLPYIRPDTLFSPKFESYLQERAHSSKAWYEKATAKLKAEGFIREDEA